MNEKPIEKDYLSVKEFADIVGISVDTLRYYDREGVFQPAKRGSENEGNYRYYAPMQITTVKMIRVLTEIGVPLKTIKEMTEGRTPEKILKLLTDNREKVADEIRFLNDVYSVINIFHELISIGISTTESKIMVSELPEKPIILGGLTDFSESTEFYGEFLNFCNASREPEINLSYPIGGYWESMDAFINESTRPRRFYSLDPNGCEKMPSGLYLNGCTRGYYGETNDLPGRMDAFAKENGLIFTGAVYNYYLFDEISITEPKNYLLKVSASVSETHRASVRRPRRHL